jgi:Protein of unknown function (DUF998)
MSQLEIRSTRWRWKGFFTPRLVALIGVISPILCVQVFTLAGFLRPGYSPIHHVISDLGVGPDGWILNTDLVISGLLFIIFAFGFYQQMRPVEMVTRQYHPTHAQRGRGDERRHLPPARSWRSGSPPLYSDTWHWPRCPLLLTYHRAPHHRMAPLQNSHMAPLWLVPVVDCPCHISLTFARGLSLSVTPG